VKYVLKKGGSHKFEPEAFEDKKSWKWDKTQMAIGDCFSETCLYKVKRITNSSAFTVSNGEEV
jgi:hypothetical protein